MKNFITTEIPQSSICNLDCKYCYIPKNKSLQKIHKKWSSKIKDGTFFEIISEYFKTGLEACSLWGGEPSLGFNDLEKVEEFLDFNPKLVNLNTSTNFANVEAFKKLLTKLDNYSRDKRKIAFGIQVSIDGTKEYTERNRGTGTYDKVLNNLKELNRFSKEIKHLKIRIHSKATNTAEDFKSFVENPQNLKDFLDSFLYIEKEIEVEKWPSNWQVDILGLPTLALPGDYTKEDGTNFYKYQVLMDELLKSDYKNYRQEDQYLYRFKTLWETEHELNRSNHIFQCSAGDCQLPLDPEGTVHMCHGTYWFNQEDYLEETYNSAAGWCEGERIVEFNASKFWNSTKSVMVEYRDKYNYNRAKYLTRSFNDLIDHPLAITYATILMLAEAGQISEVYKNDDWAKLFSMFLVLKSNCWMNNLLTTGSLFVIPLSIYRMYGNGTFEFIAKKFYETL